MYRLQLATFMGETVSIPLDGGMAYLFSRRDVLGAMGVQMFVDPEAKGTVPQASIEITRLPGSEVIWPREGTDQVVSCTPQLCPYASLVASTAPAGNGTVTERLVNFAPQSLLSTLTGSINSNAPAASQLLAFALLAHLASPDRYEPGEPVSPMLVVTPVRDRLLLRDDVLTGPGYDLGLQGDSFILAFAAAHKAVAFGTELQGELLAQAWPQELLQHPLLPPPVAAAPTTHLPPSFGKLSSGVDFLPAIKSGKDLGPEEFAALDADCLERSLGGALGPAGDVQPAGLLSVNGKLRIRRPERLLSLGGALSRSATFDALGTDEEGGHSRGSPASALSPASHKTARTMLAFVSQARADGFVTDASCSQRPVVMFRGLRVRVGVTCARLTDAGLQYNTAAARMVLGGPALAAAKALADLAHGGQVLLSCRAHEQLREELPGSNGRPSGVLLLKMGTFQQQPAYGLGRSCNGAEPFSVLWATSPALSPRLASWPPLRLPPGLGTLNDVYCAPVDRVSYVVVQIPAYRSLMAWDQQVARESLDLLYRTAQAALPGAESKGFQVETAVVVADELHFAFGEAAAAVRWVEGLRRELLAAPWPQALLDHELGEAVEADSAELPPPLPAAAAYTSPHVIRAGIATGRAAWTASSKTHALVYSGRVVAAASKLASKASCGKVLCDSATQAAAASAAAVASTTSGPQPPASAGRPGTPRPQTESALSGRLVFTPVRASSPRALSFSRPWRRKPQGEILACG
ncbi:hypothetical protein HYH03_006021 [Edaphochlamys debaryana]|uniref:Uncharacterized protein n=1 Tax=Edaphochlamys debaryana TaxID=47281 RepID=A0A836C0F6_9CHLO|nr:hypothetical protein HYH03_006021 [Edaphochlamys debaryana]|eukprot:KAG2495776.1 hypothetical protein HYH03_006021 [Edaphochlamys debaryana]